MSEPALEIAQDSVSTDGHFLLLWVPYAEGTDPTKLETLASAERITYSLTPSGFNRTITEETVNDERLTLAQVLQKAGRVTNDLEVQYVFGSEDDVAAKIFVRGAKGWLVARYAIPNEEPLAASQKADVIRIEAGIPRKDAPTTNGVWTKTQKLFVRDVRDDVALA